MPNVLTATLDQADRKRGDTYPITATLRADGAAFDLTGATVSITMVDAVSRAAIVSLGACTIVTPAAGTVSYTPSGTEAEGLYDVEFKVVKAAVNYRFPCADYTSLRMWPNLA